MEAESVEPQKNKKTTQCEGERAKEKQIVNSSYDALEGKLGLRCWISFFFKCLLFLGEGSEGDAGSLLFL